eukprot:Transcript_18524.p1 GENE.Transcript_18524~~Transcript_18524.p1  ORF type:complete len:611 (-),score=148.25 Transcript_18524:51-1883(-)
MPEPPHAPPPPPPTFLWSKEPGPSEESPLVPEAPESLRRRFAAPLPSIPWAYSCFKARRSATLTTIALLYLGILGKSIGDAALYATLPAVRAATGYPAVLTQLPAAGTVVYAVGKAVGVLTVSAVGGRNMILLALAGGTLLFFFTDGRYAIMLATWCAFRLATSQVWGGFTYIVANWVDGADVGKTMGILAVAWELGTGGAEAIFGWMLGDRGVEHWREPFYVTGFVNIAVFVVIFLFLHGTAVSAGYRMPLLKTETGGPHPLQHLRVQPTLAVFASTARFWLILVSNSCILAALYTLYFVNVYAVKALGATDQEGALILTYISIGTVTAIILATFTYDAMSKMMRAVLLTCSNLGFISLSYTTRASASRQRPARGRPPLCTMTPRRALSAPSQRGRARDGELAPLSASQVRPRGEREDDGALAHGARRRRRLLRRLWRVPADLALPDPVWRPAARVHHVQPARHDGPPCWQECHLALPKAPPRQSAWWLRGLGLLTNNLERPPGEPTHPAGRRLCRRSEARRGRRSPPQRAPKTRFRHSPRVSGIALSALASYLAGGYVENGQYIHYWGLFTANVALATTSLIAFAWTDYHVEQKALARVEPEKPSVKR